MNQSLAGSCVEEQNRSRAWMKDFRFQDGVVIHGVLFVDLPDPSRFVEEAKIVHADEIVCEQASSRRFVFVPECFPDLFLFLDKELIGRGAGGGGTSIVGGLLCVQRQEASKQEAVCVAEALPHPSPPVASIGVLYTAVVACRSEPVLDIGTHGC